MCAPSLGPGELHRLPLFTAAQHINRLIQEVDCTGKTTRMDSWVESRLQIEGVVPPGVVLGALVFVYVAGFHCYQNLIHQLNQ